jgi:hypothetical protein
MSVGLREHCTFDNHVSRCGKQDEQRKFQVKQMTVALAVGEVKQQLQEKDAAAADCRLPWN